MIETRHMKLNIYVIFLNEKNTISMDIRASEIYHKLFS